MCIYQSGVFSERVKSSQLAKNIVISKSKKKRFTDFGSSSPPLTAKERSKKIRVRFCVLEGHPSPLSFCLPKQKKSRALVVNKISLPFPHRTKNVHIIISSRRRCRPSRCASFLFALCLFLLLLVVVSFLSLLVYNYYSQKAEY